MPYYTEKQAMIHANVDPIAIPKTKSWSSWEGGDLQAATSVLHPGGTMPSLAMPGPSARTNVTVKRPYDHDLHQYVHTIEKHVGKARMFASFTPFDAEGNPNGETITRKGFLKEVTLPNYDASSGTPVYLALVMECDE